MKGCGLVNIFKLLNGVYEVMYEEFNFVDGVVNVDKNKCCWNIFWRDFFVEIWLWVYLDLNVYIGSFRRVFVNIYVFNGRVFKDGILIRDILYVVG